MFCVIDQYNVNSFSFQHGDTPKLHKEEKDGVRRASDTINNARMQMDRKVHTYGHTNGIQAANGETVWNSTPITDMKSL